MDSPTPPADPSPVQPSVPQGPESQASLGVSSGGAPAPSGPTDETIFGLPVLAELPRQSQPATRPIVPPAPQRRRVFLPLFLFVATCLSTLCIGAQARLVGVAVPVHVGWQAAERNQAWFNGYALVGDWNYGINYMIAVMAILLAHEMGHFFQAVRYRVPASFPFFIPMPLPPLGTMGAVIGMQNSTADRKQLFDIGISGPLAGLVVALPIAWIGIRDAVLANPQAPAIELHDPLLFRWFIAYLHPNLPDGALLAANPFYHAGWVGMLVTGLNMMPISQLDGGHVAYALFGRKAHWLARAVALGAFLVIVSLKAYGWSLMFLLVLFIGVEHPPTANDQAELGLTRKLIGFASLAIPILCLTPVPISFTNP